MQESTMGTTPQPRTIVMTGGSSGIGAYARTRIASQPGTRVLLGMRDGSSAPTGAVVVPLDLSELRSVRAFTAGVRKESESGGIDVLVLNAGAQFPDTAARTVDGFEPTFAVNHLAHVLIVQDLLDLIVNGGRIVITTSDTHDPEMFGMGPATLETEQWAHPVGKFSSMRAYAASKLGNLLTAGYLAAQSEVIARGITVIAYNPGLTGGTGLSRSQPPAMRRAMSVMGPVSKVVGLVRPQMRMGTPERAGQVLADLVDGRETPPDRRVYASLVAGALTYPDPSALAQDPAAADELWQISTALLAAAAAETQPRYDSNNPDNETEHA